MSGMGELQDAVFEAYARREAEAFKEWTELFAVVMNDPLTKYLNEKFPMHEAVSDRKEENDKRTDSTVGADSEGCCGCDCANRVPGSD